MASDFAAEAIYRLNEARLAPRNYGGPAEATAEERNFFAEIAPVQPLAFNPALAASTTGHASAMATDGFFSYRDPRSGSLPNGRARAAGYDLPNAAADQGNDLELIVASTAIDSPADLIDEVLRPAADGTTTQRDFVLSVDRAFAEADEIGIGHASAADGPLGHYWAIDIARRDVANRFVTGVVYDDANDNGRLDGGEGIGGATIRSGLQVTTSAPSGLYSLQLAGGDHRVRVETDSIGTAIIQEVRVGDQNVQIDFEAAGDAELNFRRRSIWTNPIRHADVNRDGTVTPFDALMVINHLSRDSSHQLPGTPAPNQPLVDTSGEGFVTSFDALVVINHLARNHLARNPLPGSTAGAVSGRPRVDAVDTAAARQDDDGTSDTGTKPDSDSGAASERRLF